MCGVIRLGVDGNGEAVMNGIRDCDEDCCIYLYSCKEVFICSTHGFLAITLRRFASAPFSNQADSTRLMSSREYFAHSRVRFIGFVSISGSSVLAYRLDKGFSLGLTQERIVKREYRHLFHQRPLLMKSRAMYEAKLSSSVGLIDLQWWFSVSTTLWEKLRYNSGTYCLWCSNSYLHFPGGRNVHIKDAQQVHLIGLYTNYAESMGCSVWEGALKKFGRLIKSQSRPYSDMRNFKDDNEMQILIKLRHDQK
ncbi:hypothetical protein Tco_0183720 [Tanacetum coccineum]